MKKLTFCVMALLGANLAFADYPTFENTANLAWEYVNNGATVVMDYNNDGYDELFYYETANGENPTHSIVYMRNSDGVITGNDVAVLGLPTGINSAGLAVIDANKDGYKDLLVAGNWPMILDLYINTDNGEGGRKFVKDETQTALRGARDWDFGHFIAVADFDGDGDEDFFVMAQMYQEGSTETAEYRGIVYINNEGTFAVGQNNFAPTRSGSACAADINKDGKIDIIYSGWSDANSTWETHYYTNSGNAEFTEVLNTGFEGTQKASIFVDDFNNDTYNDIAFLGDSKVKIYLGSESGEFTEKTNTGLSSAISVADMADFNNDGKMDFVASGWHVVGEVETGIFYGNGDGTFTAQAMATDNSARGGFTVAWDYDADGAMDYFVTNYSDTKGWYSALAHQVNPTSLYTRSVADGSWGTICLPWKSIAFEGALFYNVLGTKDAEKGIALEPIEEPNQLQAGKPYVFKATSNEIKVTYYATTAVANPVDAGNHIIGSFVECAVPNGMYIIYQNKLYITGGTNMIGEYSAYFDVDNMGTYNPGTAPAHVVFFGGSQAPTDLGQWNKDKGQRTQKLLRDGQLIILRDCKEYNAQGIEL